MYVCPETCEYVMYRWLPYLMMWQPPVLLNLEGMGNCRGVNSGGSFMVRTGA